MTSQVWWYLARASGIVGSLLLTASVLCGLLIPAKLSQRQRPAWLLDLHRWLAGLTLFFVGLHVVTLFVDSFVEFSVLDLLVPFASTWKPVPVALGVLAMWLLLAVEVTSLAKSRLPRRVWRRIHLSSYLAFFLTSLHGVLAGTDASGKPFQVTSFVTLGLVVFVTVFRILTRRRPKPRTAGAVSASAQ